MSIELRNYWKSIIATCVAIAITVVQTVQSNAKDGAWTAEDTYVTVLAFLGAVLVFAKANTSSTPQPDKSTTEPNVKPQSYKPY